MAISQNMEKRATSFGLIIICIFLVLSLRLAYLQLLEGNKYLAEAEDNRINSYNIGAPRGKVITADGHILVSNKMAYSASIRQSDLTSEAAIRKTIITLTNLLHLNRIETLESLSRSVIDGKIVLVNKLNAKQKTLVTKNLAHLPGITIEPARKGEGEGLEINVRTVNSTNLLNSCRNISVLLGLSYEDVLLKVVARGAKDRDTLKIKRNLTQEEMVILEELRPEMPGVVVERISVRDYVYGSTGSHLLGYVGAISGEELQTLKTQGYRGDDNIGKSGLEKYYESYLRGKDGSEDIEVDSHGQKIRTLGVNNPIPGSNLVTNIDLGLQMKAEQLLDETIAKLRENAKTDRDLKGGPTGGAIIVMNPNNGKILAMTSRPNFDLNMFAGGINAEDFKRLSSREANKPFVNRAVGVTPPSGSIFKIVSASTFLQEGIINQHTFVYDGNGRYIIGKWTFDNWARKTHGGYGSLNIIGALAYSNNIFFYDIAHREYRMGKGGRILPQYARYYGLGSKTGIDLPGEEPGFVPDVDWKKQTLKESWLPGNELHLSIGQGYLKTSPIQLLNLVATVANGGTLYQPYIVDRIESYDGLLIKQYEPKVMGTVPVSKENMELVKKGMVGVTTFGTAAGQMAGLPFKVAGKTGTAQSMASVANHGWFAGFAPAEKPELAVLVFLEHGTSSSYTLPIARGLFKYYIVDRHKNGGKLPTLETPVPQPLTITGSNSTNPDGTTGTNGTPGTAGSTGNTGKPNNVKPGSTTTPAGSPNGTGTTGTIPGTNNPATNSGAGTTNTGTGNQRGAGTTGTPGTAGSTPSGQKPSGTGTPNPEPDYTKLNDFYKKTFSSP